MSINEMTRGREGEEKSHTQTHIHIYTFSLIVTATLSTSSPLILLHHPHPARDGSRLLLALLLGLHDLCVCTFMYVGEKSVSTKAS